MSFNHNKNLTERARELRKNMTKEERKLWYGLLKQLPLVIKRQEVIGRYIADFYCPSKMTVIELDGSQHYEPNGADSDKIRDEYLNGKGITILRYSNADVNQNFSGVCDDIMLKLGTMKQRDY